MKGWEKRLEKNIANGLFMDADYLNEESEVDWSSVKEFIAKEISMTKKEWALKGQGWTHTDNCMDLENGIDPRNKEIPEMIDRMLKDLDLLDHKE